MRFSHNFWLGGPCWLYLGTYLCLPNMVKWSDPEKILQNAIQTHWPCVNRTPQSKVMTKSHFCRFFVYWSINLKLFVVYLNTIIGNSCPKKIAKLKTSSFGTPYWPTCFPFFQCWKISKKKSCIIPCENLAFFPSHTHKTFCQILSW